MKGSFSFYSSGRARLVTSRALFLFQRIIDKTIYLIGNQKYLLVKQEESGISYYSFFRPFFKYLLIPSGIITRIKNETMDS